MTQISISSDQFYKFYKLEKLGNVEGEQSGINLFVHTLSTAYDFLLIHLRQRYLVLANEGEPHVDT